MYVWLQSHSSDWRGGKVLLCYYVLKYAPPASRVLGPWVLVGRLGHLHTRLDFWCLGRCCHEEYAGRAQGLRSEQVILCLRYNISLCKDCSGVHLDLSCQEIQLSVHSTIQLSLEGGRVPDPSPSAARLKSLGAHENYYAAFITGIHKTHLSVIQQATAYSEEAQRGTCRRTGLILGWKVQPSACKHT